MTKRQYYSMRMGKNPNASKLDLSILIKLFRELYTDFERRGYFQEAFGDYCADEGIIPGKLGSNVSAQIFLILRKENLWSIYDKCLDYSEGDLFDIVEFIYDYISKPIDGSYHQYDECWHYNKFKKELGQQEFRERINEVLRDYKDGYELSGSLPILC
jgi:hypothetical protein